MRTQTGEEGWAPAAYLKACSKPANFGKKKVNVATGRASRTSHV